jgi:hypothetical protein
MDNKMYVHTSDLKNTTYLKNLSNFQPAFGYGIFENAISPYEYGRIKIDDFFINFLVGNIPQENCPWCSTKPILKEIKSTDCLNFDKYWMECPKCLSRGPTLDICPFLHEEEINVLLQIVHERYKMRGNWDRDINVLKVKN